MVFREALLFAQIKRENTGGAVAAAQRHGKHRLKHRDLCAISQIFRLCRGVSVDDWFFRLRDPAGNALT